MVQYLVTYSIQTGKERQHDDWWVKVGREFWRKQPGFQSIQRYSTLIGPGPDIVWEVAFDSGRDLVGALDGQEAKTVLEDFERMVDHLATKIVIPLE